jgi:hypothetical protein
MYSSSMLLQYVQVRGELPAQHPSPTPGVGAGGRVKLGGSVGGPHSASYPGIHEHTPAASHSSPVSYWVQNEYVRGEYPVQHPCSSYDGEGVVGDAVGHAVAVGGAGDVVGDGRLQSAYSPSMNVQLAAVMQAYRSSSIVEQKVLVCGVSP